MLTTASCSLTSAKPTWKREYLTQYTRQIGMGVGNGAGGRGGDSRRGGDLYVVPLCLRYHRRPVRRCEGLIDSWRHGKLRVGLDGGGGGSTDQPVNELALHHDPSPSRSSSATMIAADVVTTTVSCHHIAPDTL